MRTVFLLAFDDDAEADRLDLALRRRPSFSVRDENGSARAEYRPVTIRKITTISTKEKAA